MCFAGSNSQDRFDSFVVSDATLVVTVLLSLTRVLRLFIRNSSGQLNISRGYGIHRLRQFVDHADDTSYLRIPLFQENENPK